MVKQLNIQTYIALLRGINVSGQKLIKMELLRNALTELPIQNIRTYIQSGNIIFESEISDMKKLEFEIREKIRKNFGFEVPVTMITPADLLTIINNNPFAIENLSNATQPYVAFLSDFPMPDNMALLKAMDFGIDKFVDDGKALYIWYGDSAGKTKLSNVVIENKLKLQSTSRNWKTVLKLYEMATDSNKL